MPRVPRDRKGREPLLLRAPRLHLRRRLPVPRRPRVAADPTRRGTAWLVARRSSLVKRISSSISWYAPEKGTSDERRATSDDLLLPPLGVSARGVSSRRWP